jgi:HAD superfamily hydrolase (TIGR01509 family)
MEPRKLKKRVIIFDCDGTLVDTEYQINSAAAQILQKMGYKKYTADYCTKIFYALNMDECLDILHQDLGDSFDASTFLDDVQIAMSDSIKAGVKTMPGVKEYLQSLKNRPDLGKCVASNGEPEVVKQSLESAGIANFFDNNFIFTYKNVKVGKPAPDIFIYAAQQLGVQPEECLVIEDSAIGATAAKAAGMDFAIISPNREPLDEIKKLQPHSIIQDMREIDDIV